MPNKKYIRRKLLKKDWFKHHQLDVSHIIIPLIIKRLIQQDFMRYVMTHKSSLSQIRYFNLSFSRFKNPLKFLNPPSEPFLDVNLSRSQIRDKCLKFFKGVHSINIASSRFITDKGLKYLSGVQKINLHGCEWVTDQSLEYISGVREVVLGSLFITDKGLRNLTSKEGTYSLTLVGCRDVTDQGLSYLSKVQNIHLRVSDKITDEGLKYLDEVRSIRFCGCSGITDKGLEILTSKGRLHTIEIDHCRNITVEGLKYLNPDRGILKIFLGNHPIANRDVVYLNSIPNVTFEFCSNITDEGICILTSLGKVRIVDIRSCSEITDQALKYLSPERGVEKVNLEWLEMITNQGLKYLRGLNDIYVKDCPNVDLPESLKENNPNVDFLKSLKENNPNAIIRYRGF